MIDLELVRRGSSFTRARITHSAATSNGSKTCHPHQAEQPASGQGSRPKGFSARAGHYEHEIRYVNACARLSRFSNSAAELFSVGRRGVARAAVCGRFPATPVPAKQAHRIAFYAAANPDHLRSGGTGSSCHRYQPARFPIYAQEKEIAVASSPTPSSDVADARQPPLSLSERADASDGNPAISTRVRETLAQLGPVASDQAGSSMRRFSLTSEHSAISLRLGPTSSGDLLGIGVSIHTSKATGQSSPSVTGSTSCPRSDY
jgi:hypothetical protein